MKRLLEGVRVLDLTNVLAGPFCAYQLALQGADVIKIEAPGVGDLARQLGADPVLNQAHMGASFLAQNAGKRSLTLNLKTEAGCKIFQKLAARSDVVVENFRPGVMKRLGLSYEVLRESNPGLVYCAISGFGQDGPTSQNPAYDQIIQGLSGVMSVTGNEKSAPQRVGYPVCDTVGGLTAAFAIVCALLRKKENEEGAFLDVSMLDSTLVTLGWAVSNWLIAGVQPGPMGNENMTASPSGTFQTGEGKLNIAANKQEQFERLCDLLDMAHLVSDPRFADREARKQNRFALNKELEHALAQRSASEWEALLNQAGIPAGRVLTIPEVLEHPQVKHRGVVQRFENVPGVSGAIKILRAGFRVPNAEIEARLPPPTLGEHNDEVLRHLGLTDEEIHELVEEQAI